MNYFPINLDIKNRQCIVVGGGNVAARKVVGLLECGGKVVVISPVLSDELVKMYEENLFGWKKQGYTQGDLDGAFLVIAATDDETTQAKVFKDAEAKDLLVNVADVPERCNFILPATVNYNDLVVSISTSGKSPALASKLRKKLGKAIGPEHGVLTDILGLLRPVVLKRGQPHNENKKVFNNILNEQFSEWIKDGDWKTISEHLMRFLGDDIDQECLKKIKNMIE